jgi:hypothetical protein
MITVHMDKITLICVTDFFCIFMQLLKIQIQILMMKINPQKMIKNTLMNCMLDGVNNLVKVCTVAVY